LALHEFGGNISIPVTVAKMPPSGAIVNCLVEICRAIFWRPVPLPSVDGLCFCLGACFSDSLPSNPRCSMKQPMMFAGETLQELHPFAADFKCPMLDGRSLEFRVPAHSP
jgi:hypothetical protein